jgi:hypothetical protein
MVTWMDNHITFFIKVTKMTRYLETHNWKQRFMWFFTPLVTLVSIVLMDQTYPDGWGIRPLLRNPYMQSIYPKLHQVILTILFAYCIIVGAANILLLLTGRHMTPEETRINYCLNLQNQMKKCLLDRKKCNQIISSQEIILNDLIMEYERLEMELDGLEKKD